LEALPALKPGCDLDRATPTPAVIMKSPVIMKSVVIKHFGGP